MTLTYADIAEGSVAVAPAVDADPVKALMGAKRDGLLRYLGFVSGDRFEVEIAGRRLLLSQGEVAVTVERLRALARLSEVGVAAGLVELRDDGAHVVDVDGRVVSLPGGRVVDWCAGYAAAASGRGVDHAGEDSFGEIAKVLEEPSLADQCRLVILGLMHGRGEENRVSAEELAERVDKAKKTVVDALGFGAYMASDMAEAMIASFGLRWTVSAGGGRCERAEGGDLAEALPEMPGIARLRRILVAVRAGWLRYVDESSPNKARWSRRYRLAVGERVYVVPMEGLDAWLDGVEAFHAAGIRPA